MIHVLAEARPKPGRLAEVLACYRELVAAVRANEPDCLGYVPTVDVDLGLPNQVGRDGSVLVAERWRTVEGFRRHLAMPHCAAFRAKVLPLLERGITVRIVRPALDDVADPGPERAA